MMKRHRLQTGRTEQRIIIVNRSNMHFRGMKSTYLTNQYLIYIQPFHRSARTITF